MTLTEMVYRLIGLDKALVNSCDEPSYYDPLFEEKAELLMEIAKRLDILWKQEQEIQTLIRVKLELPPNDQS